VLVLKNEHFVDFHSRNMAIFSTFLNFVMFGIGISGTMAKKITIFINPHMCSIFHAENNLSKLQLNFSHFIGRFWPFEGLPLFINSSQNKGLSLSSIALSFDGFGWISWHSIWFFRLLYSFHNFVFRLSNLFSLSTTDET
jgi:hypothetical protein